MKENWINCLLLIIIIAIFVACLSIASDIKEIKNLLKFDAEITLETNN